jgi:hypothetical protein
VIAEPYRTWIERWEKTLAAVRAIGGKADELRIGPPAAEAEIAATERKIGMSEADLLRGHPRLTRDHRAASEARVRPTPPATEAGS